MQFDLDLTLISQHAVLLAVAYLLALPMAWNREQAARSAGLRTFPLVAVASCGYMLVGIEVLENTDARGRVFAGLITGIGFIGGGAILKIGSSVKGTATAASLWNTGAIGIAVAWGRLEVGLLMTAINFFTLKVVARLKDQLDEATSED